MATITGTDPGSFVAPVPVPVPGTRVTAGDVIATAQSLANQTKHLDNRITATDAAQQSTLDVLRGASPRLFQFNCPDGANPTMWDFQTHMGEWTQVTVAAPVCPLVVNIVGIPKGSVISEIRVTLKATGHGVSIPASLPSFQFTKCSTSTGGSMIATASDIGPVGLYDTTHQIIMSSLSETIDDTAYSYSLRLYGEGGANALAGAVRVFGVHVYFTAIP